MLNIDKTQKNEKKGLTFWTETAIIYKLLKTRWLTQRKIRSQKTEKVFKKGLTNASKCDILDKLSARAGGAILEN